jgi:hypothetical protein
VQEHYDVHLEGLCRVKGKLCRFATLNAFDEGEPPLCAVYPLTVRERLWWLWRKKRFEVCVGYHWTYPRTRSFHIRRPRWLFQALFNLHYRGLRVRRRFPFSRVAWRAHRVSTVSTIRRALLYLLAVAVLAVTLNVCIYLTR